MHDAAGDLCAGVAGRLGRKIIRVVVDDDGPADHLIYGKAVRQKQGKRKAAVSEQRRQVPGVVWMLTAVWVVMGHGVRERVVHIARAVGPFVDVESEDPLMARPLGQGQAADLGPDDHASAGLVEPHDARYTGVAFAARYPCRRLRPAAQNREKMGLRAAAE